MSSSQSLKNKSYALPPSIEKWINGELERLSLSLTHSRQLAHSIKRMADFYIENPTGATPWHEPWCLHAQLAYYFPLNYLRTSRVIDELKKHHFFPKTFQWFEFGSGLAPSLNAFIDSHIDGCQIETAHLIEQGKIPLQMAIEKLAPHFLRSPKQHETFSKKELSKDLLFMSYSLTELESLPSWFWDFERFIIIEPSTQEDGRHLMKVREEALSRGFEIIAPCTHQEACPLLHQSKKDWCHDRLHFERPEWFLEIEKFLPFKNATLTLSYLAFQKKRESARVPSTAGLSRIVGDPLKEKGKMRQLICRSSNREFISFLNKTFPEYPEFNRGDLIEIQEPFEKKGEELRAPPSQISIKTPH